MSDTSDECTVPGCNWCVTPAKSEDPPVSAQLCEQNLEAVEGLLDVLDGSRIGAGMSYAELGRLIGTDGDTMKGALNRSIDITMSDLMMIALALDVRLALGILPPVEPT